MLTCFYMQLKYNKLFRIFKDLYIQNKISKIARFANRVI